MPCGGIFPIAQHFSRTFLDLPADPATNHTCCHCKRPVDYQTDLWVEEMDSYLHRSCLGDFLCTPDGRLVITHGHMVFVPARVDEIKPEWQRAPDSTGLRP